RCQNVTGVQTCALPILASTRDDGSTEELWLVANISMVNPDIIASAVSFSEKPWTKIARSAAAAAEASITGTEGRRMSEPTTMTKIGRAACRGSGGVVGG